MQLNHRVSKLDRRTQRGYVLVEALLVTVGIGFLAVASISLQDTLTRNQAKVSIHSQLSEMRRMVMENLNNPGVWEQIVQNPENGIKQCLSDSDEVCDYRPPKAIGLEVSAASKLYIDPKKPEIGFGMNLEGCETFELKESPATACPFQASLLWQPICSVGGDCKQVEVSVDLKADPRFEKLYSFSSESYSLKIKKNVSLKKTEMVPGSRTLSFKADSSAPKAVKVFLIVDNSTSMTDNRETMAKGLESFVEGMKGYDVQYYVYTTESIVNAIWNYYPYIDETELSPTRVWDYGPGIWTMPDNSTKPGRFDWMTVPSQKFKRWDGRIQLAPDMGQRWNLDLHQDANETNLAGIKATLTKIMRDVENPKADLEGGLCTMAHILNDTGPNSPLKPGDSAIFLTMSDEDDVGFTNDGGYSTICPGNIGVRPNDESLVHHAHCDRSRPETCDSMQISLRKPDKYYKTLYFQWKQKDSVWDAWADTCESFVKGECGETGTEMACTRAEVPWADPDGWKWNNKCTAKVQRSTQEEWWLLDRKDLDSGNVNPNKDYCTQPFTYKGVNYTDAKDFAVRFGKIDLASLHATKPTCWLNFYTHEPFQEAQWAILNSEHETGNDLWDWKKYQKPMETLYASIPGKLRETFGQDGYGVYTVVHDKDRDASAGCVLAEDSGSYGSKYKDVLLATDTPGNLISVCQDNYSASIEHMRTQAQQIARDTYVLDPFDPNTERVYSVQVQRGGAPLILTKADYGISGSNVQFKAGFIQGSDQITVVIVPK